MRRANDKRTHPTTRTSPESLPETALRHVEGGNPMFQRSPAGTAEDGPPTGGTF